MARKRTNEAVWLPKYNRWQINVQRDNERRTFTCSKPGRAGKIECHQKADRWLAAGAPSASDTRISSIYAAMLDNARANTSTGNCVALDNYGKTWILPRIGSRKIEDLTVQDLQRILNAAAQKGLSRKTISNIRGAITSMLKYARLSGMTQLYATDLEIPRNAKRKEKHILSLDQIAVLMSDDTTTDHGQPLSDWYINAYRLILTIGLRPGELCELQRAKQTSDAVLSVHGSYNKYGEHTEGKTQNAKRFISLPQAAITIMRAQEDMLRSAGIVSPFLFPQEDGSQTTSMLLYERWRRYQRTHDFTPQISVYELRHTFASLCRHGGVPEELLKSVMGHSYNMPSYGVYGHNFGDETAIVAGMIDNSLANVLKAK